MTKTPVRATFVERFERGRLSGSQDLVAVEEPLQILLEHGPLHQRAETPLAVTMRTPGHDEDLVLGFLYAEGAIDSLDDVIDVRHCANAEEPQNVVRAILSPSTTVPPRLLERTLAVTSSCGVCGKRTLADLEREGCVPLGEGLRTIGSDAIRRAVRSLGASQPCFRHTGGSHGAALFDAAGTLALVREDVGRHNALDKLVGASMRERGETTDLGLVVISSRASFELVQKVVRRRIPVLVAIGAPSSLAIDAARRFHLTLIAFARGDRFNVYSASERFRLDETQGDFAEVRIT